MPQSDTPLAGAPAALRDALGDRVVLPADAGYDAARLAWNLAIDQRPAAVVCPENADEVVQSVCAAVAAGLRVAPQSTGHGAGSLATTDLSDVMLMSLARMRGVTVDPETRIAHVLGGSHWNDVLAVAAPLGLTALHGSAGDVSVVGYTLNGGLSFYGRHHGLAVNTVRSVQLVTADGQVSRASADENPDLFWAVRGGSGAFGVVVSLELELLPYADVFAGMLLWDATHAPAVAHAWSSWSASAPETVTTTLRVMHFPPMADLPPFLSGRSLVVIDGAMLESDAVGAELLEPLRAMGPEVDTFARIPAAALVGVHMDPPNPSPAVTFHAMVDGFPAEAVDALLAATNTPGLFITEVRHAGGAFTRRPEHGGAVASLDGAYLVAGVAIVPVPHAQQQALAAVEAAVASVGAWHVDSLALTFVDGPADLAAGFGESAARLADLKNRFDPHNVFAAARPV